MVLIVGLGNPGSKYHYTRHNVGFMAVEALLKKLSGVEASVWGIDGRFKCLLARVGGESANIVQNSKFKIQSQVQNSKLKTDEGLLLMKPQTFMNASGAAVAKVLKFYKINPLGLFVIHDEIDLPLGKVKIAVNRGAAGHHGVESIIKEVGTTNFVRIRVGIGFTSFRLLSGLRGINGIREIWGRTRLRRGFGETRRATEDYVLQPFQKNEEGRLNDVIKKTVDIMMAILEDGVEKAMGKYN